MNTIPNNTVIDPNSYENPLGTLSSVSNQKFTTQRFYSFTSNTLKVQYGQLQYNSLAEAEADLTGSFTTEPSISANGLLIGYLIVKKGTTNLTTAIDSGNAKFFIASKFGAVGSNTNQIVPRSAGWLYTQSNATVTDITAINTPTVLACTTTLVNTNDFAMPNDLQLQYTGSQTKSFRVMATFSHEQDESSTRELVTFMLYKDTNVITGSRVQVTSDDNGDVPQAVTLQCITTLATNEYITIRMENNEEITDHLVIDLQLTASEL